MYNLGLALRPCYEQKQPFRDLLSIKGVLKICSKFTGEQPCQSVISINLQSNFIEITLWRGCSPANSIHIFRTRISNIDQAENLSIIMLKIKDKTELFIFT